jgi:exodeoxyribonuclease VII small subunit
VNRGRILADPRLRQPLTHDNAPKKSPRGAGSGKSTDAEGFESRLDKLRRIVDELESGDMPLEKAIARYSEGVAVLKSCAETLASARLRVEELTKDAEATLGLREAADLEAEADPDDDERPEE